MANEWPSSFRFALHRRSLRAIPHVNPSDTSRFDVCPPALNHIVIILALFIRWNFAVQYSTCADIFQC